MNPRSTELLKSVTLCVIEQHLADLDLDKVCLTKKGVPVIPNFNYEEGRYKTATIDAHPGPKRILLGKISSRITKKRPELDSSISEKKFFELSRSSDATVLLVKHKDGSETLSLLPNKHRGVIIYAEDLFGVHNHYYSIEIS